MALKRKFFIIALLGCFLVLLASASSWSQYQGGERLNQEAFSLFHRGDSAGALQLWKEAEALYQSEGNQEGEIGTQLNQSLAEQALGLYPSACLTVTQALSLPREVCQAYQEELLEQSLSKIEFMDVNGIGLRLLGESLSLLGNLKEAKLALEAAQTYVEPNSIEFRRIDLETGNVYKLLVKEAIQKYQRMSPGEVISRSNTISQMTEAGKAAIVRYQSAMDSDDISLSTKAKLNIISLFADVHDDFSQVNAGDTTAVLSQLDMTAQIAFRHLHYRSFERFPVIEAVYSQLNLVKSLLSIQLDRTNTSWSNIPSSKIYSLIEEATSTAKQIQNNRALSSAYGIEGDFLVQERQSTAIAAELYQQALSTALSVQSFDLAYQWAYKLAQISEEAGNLSKADEYYQTAISALSAVRNDLLEVNSEVRFSFRQKIEPVYRSYIRFLSQKQKNFDQAIKVHSSLQLAQLENLLRCGRLVSTAKTSDKTTVHIINLGDVVEVIVLRNDEFYSYSFPASEVLPITESLIANTQSENFYRIPETEFLPYTQLLYDKLIRPAETAGWLLRGTEISFVLDTPFQSVPMGMLHDGQRYLAEAHPLSVSLQMQQAERAEKGVGGLFAGLSEVAPSFEQAPGISNSPLPETQYEAQYVGNYVRSNILLDKAFTIEQLARQLVQKRFEIVHFSTHGQFSSDSDETFLLAWDERIDFARLGQLFRRAEGIDLLFLSACETATGDERAALGLAGLAIQTGAINAIAPLWFQDSTGGSVLVDSFYKGLAAELSPSESLQQAQINLITSDAFSHPYYWAPFILAAR